MNLSVYHDDLSISQYPLEASYFTNEKLHSLVGYIGSNSKEENALQIIQAFYNDSKAILFDHTNKMITQKLQELNIPNFQTQEKIPTIFDNEIFNLIFFTSGSTGQSVGALKTKEHLLNEIEVLTQLFKERKITKVIVTVPFIHIYGTLFGLLYPLMNGLDIILKEHFLPHDLLNLIDEQSLVVTTPLYIKALNQIEHNEDISNATFISSTAPLAPEIAKEFNTKFKCDVIQIFGSTETGGIAYKFNDDSLWTALDRVNISTNEDEELKIASPFVSDVLFENVFKTINGAIQTFDYIELHDNRQFKLIGRSSQILKIAGKRYSTIQIEHILEEQPDISKACVFVTQKENLLKDEVLEIVLETKNPYTPKEIKQILKEHLSNLKFSIELKIVDTIPVSSVGKKLKIL